MKGSPVKALLLKIKELELLLGPQDSEVHLRKILRNASRRGGRIFEITIEKSEHLLQAKCDGMSVRSNVQDADDEDDHFWTEACEGIAKRMVKYLEEREVTLARVKERVSLSG